MPLLAPGDGSPGSAALTHPLPLFQGDAGVSFTSPIPQPCFCCSRLRNGALIKVANLTAMVAVLLRCQDPYGRDVQIINIH